MIGSSTSARFLSVALLTLVLAAGFLMGMAWDGGDAAARVVEEDPRPEEPERRSRVIDQVGLEPGQQEQVDRIVEHYRARMKDLDQEFREAYRPRQREVVRQTRDSIKAILRPEQAMLYDSLIEARYGRGNGSDGEARDGDDSGRGGGGSQ